MRRRRPAALLLGCCTGPLAVPRSPWREGWGEAEWLPPHIWLTISASAVAICAGWGRRPCVVGRQVGGGGWAHTQLGG